MPANTRRPLLLLLFLAAATAVGMTMTVADTAAPPTPTPWPEQFHAVLFTNLTVSGGRLHMADLYYDWPRRRNLNLIRYQLADEPLYDVEWNNGTTYYFDSASCRTLQFDVGVLPPDWLVDGAVYLGRARTGGFDCHVWTKFDFVWYFEDVLTRRPVRWNFKDRGIQQHVMSFEIGAVLDDDSQWQAPAHCFSHHDVTKNGTNLDEVAEAVSVSLTLSKFAGAAAAGL